MQNLSNNEKVTMKYKRFKGLTWKEILWLRNNPSVPKEDHVDMRNFVYGFCAFVRSNWVDHKRTYKNAFEFFKHDYLEERVNVPNNID